MTFNLLTLISILISTTLAFFTVAFVIELLIVSFRIKQHRIRSNLRLLPFLSLIVDFIFQKLNIGNWLNPLSCDSCIQKFLLQLYFPELKVYLSTNEISLVRYLASQNLQEFSLAIFVLFGSITAFFIIKRIYQTLFLNRLLSSITQNGVTCIRPIENIPLASLLNLKNIKILISDEIQIPMATNSKTIFIPKKIVENFPQDEFETIVAHELEHIRWKDPLIRQFLHFTSSLFWWVPAYSWTKKIEQDQEMACDGSVLTYGLHFESLASALVKVIKQTQNNDHEVLCYLTHKKNPSLARLQIMLGLNLIIKKNAFQVTCAVIFFALLLLMGCL